MAARKPVPQKSAAYRARQAANSKAYRARKAAEKYGVDVPQQYALQRPAQYHPPTKELKAVLGGRTPAERERRARSHARYQSEKTAAERAAAKAQEARAARAAFIGQLPQGRNVKGEIFVPRPLKRKVAKNADAATIRRRAAAEKLQAAGRGLKRDFKSKPGTVYAEIEKKLSRSERAQFREYVDRLANLSNQALAIYFHHEGGSGLLDSIITGILYPPDGSSPSDALKRMERLVQEAEQGERNYGEAAIGKQDI